MIDKYKEVIPDEHWDEFVKFISDSDHEQDYTDEFAEYIEQNSPLVERIMAELR